MDFDWMFEENGDVILQLEKERDALRAENKRLRERTCLMCNMLERQDCAQEKTDLRVENERLREAVWHELRRVGVDDYGNPVPAVGFDSRLYRAITKSAERESDGGAP